MNNQINREKLMDEVLTLQGEWYRSLRDLIKGRQINELTEDEQRRFSQICQEFNRHIEDRMEIIYPELKE